MIQTLEEMIRIYCVYGIKFKDSYCLTHDWCTLIQPLELAYNTSIQSSIVKTPAILEKGWNSRLPSDTLENDLVDINPTASSCKMMLDKARHHYNRFLPDSFKYCQPVTQSQSTSMTAKYHKPMV
ncbi:hypothetical protein O181_084264 [Austropuccinia psidii MF-1]|uniref:Uncharacterized protein n=1 Tax=Austropuccinia psidii MF-1 TaxID=1389203 RepID=A0A9Q3FT50_9BASI|nr:hypothetical protein [Austropuccinia psidii MF-1]